MAKILIFGNGWIGRYFKEFYSNTSDSVSLTETNIVDKLAVVMILEEMNPDVVLNATAKTGRPNIDWCETHTKETFESNVLGPAILLEECNRKNIFLVHLSSDTVFGDPLPRSTGFTELDNPSPSSFYARTKFWAEQLLQESGHDLPLIVRLRTVVGDTYSPRNFLTKLASYQYVANQTNSLSVISSLVMAVNALIRKRKRGIYHVVNPDPISYSEILELYKEYIDSTHTYELVSEQELVSRRLIQAPRPNCILDTSKLQSEGISLFPTQDAIIMCLKNYAKSQVK